MPADILSGFAEFISLTIERCSRSEWRPIMKYRLCGTMIVSVVTLLAVAGCQSCHPHLFPNRPVAVNYPPSAPVAVYPAPHPPLAQQPPPPAPPAPVDLRSYSPPPAPADSAWHPPANGGTRL